LGRRQVVRHRILIPAFGGSNPPAPAILLRASQDLPRYMRRSRMPSEALAKEGWSSMHYVYLIRSPEYPSERYVGLCTDLKRRLRQHNAGESAHTSKFKPWELVTYIAFSDAEKAQYLKQGSGHAFANKRLW
jgi:putative endonuclease